MPYLKFITHFTKVECVYWDTLRTVSTTYSFAKVRDAILSETAICLPSSFECFKKKSVQGFFPKNTPYFKQELTLRYVFWCRNRGSHYSFWLCKLVKTHILHSDYLQVPCIYERHCAFQLHWNSVTQTQENPSWVKSWGTALILYSVLLWVSSPASP